VKRWREFMAPQKRWLPRAHDEESAMVAKPQRTYD
jgi:hypothetical protein